MLYDKDGTELGVSPTYYNVPCLAYNDVNKQNCAMCKPGTARIFVTTDDGDKYVVCGSVRKPAIIDNQYEYLNPDTANQDDFEGQEYQCFISPYYAGILPSVWQQSDRVYYPVSYYNMTDGIRETLCIRLEDYVDSQSCNHATVVPSQDYINSLTLDSQAVQSLVIPGTVGCNDCATNYIAQVEYDDAFGLYYQRCANSNEFDFEEQYTPCEDLGYIQVLEGYIEAE